MQVFFLGPEGTHTHHAMTQFINSLSLTHGHIVPCPSVEFVLRTLANSKDISDRAVIPLENSFGGSVTATWDTFLQLVMEQAQPGGVVPRIRRSVTLPIEHALFAAPGTSLLDLKVIYSHPQALAQCSTWLQENVPNVRCVAVESTAEAAHRVSGTVSRSEGAIASPVGGNAFGLVCLATSLQGSSNATRFGWIEIGPRDSEEIDPSQSLRQTVILVGVRNEPGGLFEALKVFHATGLNLTRIESRPVGGRMGEYAFFLDIDWNPEKLENRIGLWQYVEEHLSVQGTQVYDLGIYNEIPHAPKSGNGG